ncbi:YesK family protein [Bacillus mexicanus]|uniref:YesK family protein n=1 Tax=Bacillus mexicanus TaxID=2834415 RepID=UPI003D1A9999
MFLFAPLGLGALIGIIIIVLSMTLKKKSASSAKVPAYAGVIISVILFCIGYFIVRGFEGAAYSILGIIIFIFTIFAFFVAQKK